MKYIKIYIVHNYTPFNKEHVFFAYTYENETLIKINSGRYIGVKMFNLFLTSIANSINDIEENLEDLKIDVLFKEDDFDIFKLNKFLKDISIVSEYEACEELKQVLDYRKYINTISTAKNYIDKNILNEIYNKHF